MCGCVYGCAHPQIHFFMLMSRQGKVRLAKWYSTYSQKERARVVKETTPLVLSRPLKLCNFVDWKNIKLVYKRYASLYFLCGVDQSDNELLVLEVIHHFVECLDGYFGNVCELDLIFNFHKAYYILDELLIAGRWVAGNGRALGVGDWVACAYSCWHQAGRRVWAADADAVSRSWREAVWRNRAVAAAHSTAQRLRLLWHAASIPQRPRRQQRQRQVAQTTAK